MRRKTAGPENPPRVLIEIRGTKAETRVEVRFFPRPQPRLPPADGPSLCLRHSQSLPFCFSLQPRAQRITLRTCTGGRGWGAKREEKKIRGINKIYTRRPMHTVHADGAGREGEMGVRAQRRRGGG